MLSQIMNFSRLIPLLGFTVVYTGACVHGVEVDFSRFAEPADKDAGKGAADGAFKGGGKDANPLSGSKGKDAGYGAADGAFKEGGNDANLLAYALDSGGAPRPSICGNGVVEDKEACDDGNSMSHDGCSELCVVEEGFSCPPRGGLCDACGNGKLGGTEACDDGNLRSGDGCDSTCRLETGWSCPIAGMRCIANACGDSIIAGDEQCDDGNTVGNDGCSATCRLEEGYVCKTVGKPCTHTVCNDGIKEGTEPCDDGNNVIGDGCNPFCEVEPICGQDGCKSSCGDGIMLASDNEQCDDGNTLNNDGCSSDCKIEAGYKCTVVAAQLSDTLWAPITYRDFISFPIGDAVRHPDFEASYGGNNTTMGLVAANLGADGKPVYTGICGDNLASPTPTCPYLRQTTTEADFNQWYRDTSGVNIASIQRLPLVKRDDGSYYYPDNILFPLDGAGWVALGREGVHSAEVWAANVSKYVDDGLRHNFGFTTELRYWFEFKGGESLTFSGDDDVWVFINRRLALDLGGLHPPREGTVTINSSGVGTWLRNDIGGQVTGKTADLALTVGKIYEIVLFHAERHTLASNFNLTVKGFIKGKSACTTICGDGIVTRDELCDDGVNDGSYGGCMPTCLARGPFCGDGHVDSPKEKCDDGVPNGGYGGYNQCAPGCVRGPYCGDGHKDDNEYCDDGNNVNGDGCGADCGKDIVIR
jgi:fibro-slime domain-containing protein